MQDVKPDSFIARAMRGRLCVCRVNFWIYYTGPGLDGMTEVEEPLPCIE